jgi:hypothetical protein
MRREMARLSEENYKNVIHKVETFYSIKADIELKEVKETVYNINNELDGLNRKFNREKHIFSKDSVDNMQERHQAKKFAETMRTSQEENFNAKICRLE